MNDQPRLLREALAAIETLQARLSAAERARHEPIAILGIGCRYPGGVIDPESLWRLVSERGDAVTTIPADRWDAAAHHDARAGTPGKMLSPRGGFIADVDRFDAAFFGVTPREAQWIDPQQRMLLETALEATERAGIARETLAGRRVGVFVGATSNDYLNLTRELPLSESDIYSVNGGGLHAAAGRVAFTFGLVGPCVTLDTACSSSLVAIHLACQSLRTGESELALAGGANLILEPRGAIVFSAGGVMAADGSCKAFDAGADGFVRAEGCGMILLKRLTDAVRDGDPVVALIRGSAVNSDGRSAGLTQPYGPAQEALIRTALAGAGLAPADIDYVEAHGTGTPIGDPIEVEAIANVLGEGRPADRPIVLGSIKTNIGHSEAASGLAGLIKTVMALSHETIPPTLHLATPSPLIDWAALPVTVARDSVAWPRDLARPRRAGISSFGFSGTNAHVIVEEAPASAAPLPAAPLPAAAPAPAATPMLVALSARGPQALQALASRHAEWLAAHPETPLADVALTLGAGRDHLARRAALIVADTRELVDGLREIAADAVPTGGAVATVRGTPGGVAFLFTGQGAQYAGMGRALYGSEPVFRASLDHAAAILDPLLDRALLSVLFADGAEAALVNETGYTQPALFALECALAALWAARGIVPTAVMGHSVGEYSAACVAGVIGFEDGLRLIAERGRLMQALPRGGGMAAVFADEARARAAIAAYPDRLAIAAINGAAETVISGDLAALREVLAALGADGVESRALDVSHAFHSPLLDPMLDAFAARASQVTYHAPRIPLISNVTGRAFGADERPDAAYWRRHARGTVRFAASLAELATFDIGAVVEVGPHPTLLALAARAVPDAPWPTIASLRRGRDDRREMLAAARDLYVAGIAPAWTAMPGARDGRRRALPTYPFQRDRHWIRTLTAAERRLGGGPGGHPLLGERQWTPGPDIGFLAEVAADRPAFVADHVVFGSVVMAGAAYVEMLLAAARALGIGRMPAISDMIVEAPLVLEDGETTRLHTMLTPDGRGRYAAVIRSAAAADPIATGDAWTVHARASIHGVAAATGGGVDTAQDMSGAARDTTGAARDTAGAAPAGMTAMASAPMYRELAALGLAFGERFRAVSALEGAADRSRGTVTLPAGEAADDYVVHPVLIDAALQLVAGIARDRVHVPVAFDRIVLHGRPAPVMRGTVTLSEPADGSGSVRADIRLDTERGEPVLSLTGCTFQAVAPDMLRRGRRGRRAVSYRPVWTPIAAGPAIGAERRFLLVGGEDEFAAALAEAIVGAGAQVRRIAADAMAALQPDADEGAAMVIDLRATVALAAGGPITRASRRYLDALDLARQVSAAPGLGLCIVTRGAHAIAPGDEIALDQTPLVGLARSLDAEEPHARRVRIDLDPGTAPDARALLAALRSAGADEPELALRHGAPLAPRLERTPPPERDLAADGRSVLTITERGDLDGLHAVELPRVAPGPGEIELEVRAAGLNFRDVLNALGMYPAPVPPLGSECAGIVTALGAGVTALAIGDAVVAIAPESFASHCTVGAAMVVRKPAGISFAEAVTIPNAYLTALLCLRIGNLKPGQRVLVHAAAGGVGSAAVTLARHFGLEVFATAGNAEKRAFATARGAAHVFDSRSTAFADEILAVTGGEGVDLVINSLAAEFIDAGLRIVRPGGAFVEIGKQGVWSVEQAAARAPGVRYSVEDLGANITDDPAAVRRDFELVMRLAAEGAIDPLPLRVFPLGGAKQAFRHMANARHIGKLVLVPDRWSPPAEIAANGTYLVTGGLGGIGRRIVAWLAERGAGHILVTGRREADAAERAALDALGGAISVVACDVADADAVAALWRDTLPALPPLTGIVHAAGVLADAPLAEQDAAGWDAVAAPKVAGGWHLHAASARDPITLFALFSSTSALLGSPGQANYAGANAWLDGLAAHRRLHGLPAVSIAWGPWAQVGMAAGLEAQHALWERAGIGLIAPAQGIAAFERALGDAAPYAAIMAIDAARLAAASHGGAAAMLRTGAAPVAATATTGARDAARAVIDAFRQAGGGPAERRALLVTFVHNEVARVLGFTPASLDPNASLVELGLDSLMAVQLRNTLRSQLAADLPVKELLEGPTVVQLADVLADVLDRAAPAEPAADWEDGAL